MAGRSRLPQATRRCSNRGRHRWLSRRNIRAPVAAVAHTATPDLEREIGAAVRLALENELLDVEVQAQLGDLRLTVRNAQAEGDHEAASLLAEANGTALAALEELRKLAHGLYPAVLGQVGLAAALRTLAVTAPLPVEVDDVTAARHPEPVEMAAYRVVSEALDGAAERGASYAAVGAQAEDGWLVVTVIDDVMLTRQGIVDVLTDAGIDVVGEATNAEELLRQVRDARPDAAIGVRRVPDQGAGVRRRDPR